MADSAQASLEVLDVHRATCQEHTPDALGGLRGINKAEDYIKSLLETRLLHNTPSVETV